MADLPRDGKGELKGAKFILKITWPRKFVLTWKTLYLETLEKKGFTDLLPYESNRFYWTPWQVTLGWTEKGTKH